MSRAMFVQGFRETPPGTGEGREAVKIDMSFGTKPGVTDTDDEPDAIGCVLIEIDKLDPGIRFVRVYCL